MDLSDEEVLLESFCFLLTYHQEQIKRKRKYKWVSEMFQKLTEQGVYHNLLYTAQKMKFSIYDFFSKWDKIRRKLRIL